MRLRTLSVIAIASSLSLVPLACGDDDDEDTAATVEEAGEAVTDTAGEAVTDTATADTLAPTDTTAAGAGGGEASEFCSIYGELEGMLNLNPEGTPAEVEAMLTELTGRADDLVEAAPDEIRDDVEKVAEAFTRLRDEAEATGYDLAPIATNAALEAEFTSGEFEEAGNNMDAYYEENCAATTATT